MAKVKSKKITLEEALVPVEEQPYEVPENWCWTYLLNGFAECKDGNRKPINASETHLSEPIEKEIFLIMGQQDRLGGLMITLQMSSWYYWVKMVHHF